MKPNSYILLTIQIFRTKIYIPILSQVTEGVSKVSCFHISSRLKKERKQVLVKKYIGFVGSQPMLLLFDACLNIWCKSNNIGCDPTNPMYLENFFTSIIIR